MSELPPPKAGAGVIDLLRLFRKDQLAADGYAASCLEKARAIEPKLKAFEVLPADVQRRPGPLSGIPVAIKDIIATSDMPTTNGSPIYKDHVPAADASVVERLRQLGATIFGKTVSTEFAWRQPGPTVNPWNAEHTPGGSSSGSAAAVAAGLVPLALGSQTLGLRDPARGVQRHCRLQAELWRDPAHGRASAQPVARSCRLLRAPRRRCRARRCRCLQPRATMICMAGRCRLFRSTSNMALSR